MASPYSPTKAKRRNPDLAINPPASSFGSQNAILTGTSRRYYVPDFRGPLSVKATLQGTATWKVNGRSFRVSESAFLVVNAEQPYTIAYEEPHDVTTFCLLFQAGFVEQLRTAMWVAPQTSLDDPFRADRTEFRIGLQSGPNAVLDRLRTFAKLLGSEEVSGEMWELSFQELAISLLRETHSVPVAAEDLRAVKGSTRQELLRRVLVGKDFIISMSECPIKVEDAAKAACLSTFHFHRVFVQAFGISPHQFLRNFRLLRAGQMLRSSDLPVTEIAHRVGFQSLGSFGTAFNKEYGVAPVAYRSGSK